MELRIMRPFVRLAAPPISPADPQASHPTRVPLRRPFRTGPAWECCGCCDARSRPARHRCRLGEPDLRQLPGGRRAPVSCSASETRFMVPQPGGEIQVRPLQHPDGRRACDDGFHRHHSWSAHFAAGWHRRRPEARATWLTKTGLPGSPSASESRMKVPATSRTTCQDVMVTLLEGLARGDCGRPRSTAPGLPPA